MQWLCKKPCYWNAQNLDLLRVEKHCKIQIDLFSLKEFKLTYLSESYLSLKRMVFLNAVKESLLCFVGFYNTMFCFISQEDEDEMVVQLGSSGDEDEREDPLSFIPTPENSDESSDDSEDDVWVHGVTGLLMATL